jgi:hypothetical protein
LDGNAKTKQRTPDGCLFVGLLVGLLVYLLVCLFVTKLLRKLVRVSLSALSENINMFVLRPKRASLSLFTDLEKST